MDDCTICMVIAERRYLERHEHGVVIKPDNSLGDGHLIVAPLTHLRSFAQNPVIAAQVMRLAALKAVEPCAVIWPLGVPARQMIPHIYAQIIPAHLAVVQAIPTGEMLGERSKTRNGGRSIRGRGDVHVGPESAGGEGPAGGASGVPGLNDSEAPSDARGSLPSV